MKDTLHIYTRVSTGVQEEKGTSLSSQRESGISYSGKHGFKHKVWNEGSQSSSKDDLDNRPVLTQLLHEVDEGNIKHIYVYNPDRLSRNQNTWGFIRYKLLQKEVVLHTPGGKYDLTDFTTNLMLGILSEISQYENKVRTERFRVGKLQRIREGRWKGGPPPYGYDLVDGELVPNKEQVKTVKWMFDRYNNGWSPDKIRMALLEKGILSPRGNGMWSEPSIRKVLSNTHYKGYWTYKDKKSGEVIHNKSPQILSATCIQMYDKVKKRRTRKVENPNGLREVSNQKHEYLLNNVLECGGCGSGFVGNIKKNQSSNYGCRRKFNKYRTREINFEPCSQKRYLNLTKTDIVVWEAVLEVVEKSHLFKEMTKKELLPSKSKKQEQKTEEKNINNKIKKLNKQLTTLQSAIVGQETQKVLVGSKNIDKVIEQLEKQRISLESEVEELQSRLSKMSENDKWVDWYNYFGRRMKKLREDDGISILEKKRFLEGLVDKIVVTENNNQEHTLKIMFRQPYVGDKLIYNDPDNKRKGYSLKDGKKVKTLTTSLSKKSLTNTG